MHLLQRVTLLFLLASVTLFAANKHILLLHSYNKGIFWSDTISKGVEDVLASYKEYQLTTEYMDTKKNEDPEYLNLLHQLFASKLKYQSFDAVIAADDFAVQFVLDHKDQLFPKVPVFFCGIEKSKPGVDVERIKREGIPLVFESKEIAINMRFLKQAMPKLKNVYIISDKTNDSMNINSFFEAEAKKLEREGIHTSMYIDGDLEKIAYDITHLPPNSVVMLGTLARDNHGNYIPYYKVSDLIHQSLAPVFAVGDTLLNKGIVGGYLLRGYTNGVTVAQLMVYALNGKKIDATKPIVVPSEWMFDYTMLQKYGIDRSRLPKEATIINPPKSFFDEHRQFVENAFIVFPVVLISLLLAMLNIYQQYKTAQKLAARQYWEQVLLSNVNSSIFWIDTKGVIKGCNDAFCSFAEQSLDNIIGKNVCEVFSLLCQAIPKEQLFALDEMDFTWKEKTYHLRSRQFLDENSKNGGIVCVITDITDKKQLEIHTQLNIQQSKLAEIGEMLSAIVHQWKVPLVELSAVAHKMHYYDKKKKLTSEDIQKFYDIIMQQTIYMGETIDGFRDFIRPSNEAKRFYFHSVVQDVSSLLSHSLKYHHIQIVWENEDALDFHMWGYPNELKQVFVNIFNNAKDAILEAREKHHASSGTIRIVARRDDTNIHICIEDDGIGIEAESQEKLFEPFFTTKAQGDGFGLYMARLIIESKMQGHIVLEPLSQGVRVCVSLPILQESQK